MKRIFIMTICLLFSLNNSAQQNKLNDTELFDEVRFAGVSLGDIMTAKGDLAKLSSYFGSNLAEKTDNTSPFKSKFIFDSNISMGFEDETNTGSDFDLSWIAVRNEFIEVTVKGIRIKLKDDKSKLQAFQFNNSANSYVFTDADTGTTSLVFVIDNNEKIKEIKFISNY